MTRAFFLRGPVGCWRHLDPHLSVIWPVERHSKHSLALGCTIFSTQPLCIVTQPSGNAKFGVNCPARLYIWGRGAKGLRVGERVV